MKFLPKIVFALGLLLIAFNFVIPNNYEKCHSDLIIAGYNDSQICMPDIIYQFSEASLFVGIICVFISVILKETLEETIELPISIIKGK